MRPTTREEFQVAIIFALPLEADAVKASFDETYDDHDNPYNKRLGDTNVFINGRTGQHHVVLCHLPGMGKGSGAAAASNLRMNYPWIQLALVVGICGVVPLSADSFRISIGDIDISNSLVEYDFRRQYADSFRRREDPKNTFGRLPGEIRTVLSSLQTEDKHNQFRKRAHHHLDALQAWDSV